MRAISDQGQAQRRLSISDERVIVADGKARESRRPRRRSASTMSRWRALRHHVAQRAVGDRVFRYPPNRVVELGAQVEF
jgi:hypothetical protein